MKTNLTWRKTLALMMAMTLVMLTFTGCNATGPSAGENPEDEATALTQEEINGLQADNERLQNELEELQTENQRLQEELDELQLAAAEQDESETGEGAEADTTEADALAATGTGATQTTDITAVTFIKSTDLTLSVGDTNRRSAATTPPGGAVAYASSNSMVASVATDGNVTCTASGKAVISATSGSAKDSYNLTVTALAVQSPPSTPAAPSGSGSTNGTGVFAGYTVTVHDKTTPATSSSGNSDYTVYTFYSADGKALGTITGKAANAILSKYVANGIAPSESKERAVWFAEQFNLYRGLSAGASGGTANTSFDVDEAAKEVIRLVNTEREKVGQPALTESSSLNSHSMIRAKELAISYSHTRPDGTTEDSECIVKNRASAAAAFQAWMDSDAHRNAILNEDGRFIYNYIGTGCYEDSNGTLYWVITFSV